MVTLHHTSKKAQSFLRAYYNSTATELRELYSRYSSYKHFGWACCKKLCDLDNGKSFRIFSANTFTFTAAWTRGDGNVRVETRNNSYLIKFNSYEKIYHA